MNDHTDWDEVFYRDLRYVDGYGWCLPISATERYELKKHLRRLTERLNATQGSLDNQAAKWSELTRVISVEFKDEPEVVPGHDVGSIAVELIRRLLWENDLLKTASKAIHMIVSHDLKGVRR